MATITTGIQLADNFSAPLMHIISSVNMAISSIYDMDQAMNAGVNTASWKLPGMKLHRQL